MPISEPTAPTNGGCRLLDACPALSSVKEKIRKLKGKPSLNILILGESGVGKELIAKALHAQESSNRPLVIANMPAIPTTLIETELFGVEKGAYTHAVQSRAGKFELANGGDIFLDEIGDLSFEAQAKLLRVLQERTFERVGSAKPRSTQVRVFSATNRDLRALVREGQFREDLLYRLGDVILSIPPLRERREDIPVLAEHFVSKYSALFRKERPSFSKSALSRLISYPWPGNVRELESTIKRTITFNDSSVIETLELDDAHAWDSTKPATYRERLKEMERDLIQDALHRCRGSVSWTMKELGLSRATFYRRLQKLKEVPVTL